MDAAPGVLRLLDAQAWWLAPADGPLHCLRQEVRRCGGVSVGSVRRPAWGRCPKAGEKPFHRPGKGIAGGFRGQAEEPFCGAGEQTSLPRVSDRKLNWI